MSKIVKAGRYWHLQTDKTRLDITCKEDRLLLSQPHFFKTKKDLIKWINGDVFFAVRPLLKVKAGHYLTYDNKFDLKQLDGYWYLYPRRAHMLWDSLVLFDQIDGWIKWHRLDEPYPTLSLLCESLLDALDKDASFRCLPR